MLSTQPPTTRHRLEICPPERASAPQPWWRRVQVWVAAGWPGPTAGPDTALEQARREFLAAADDLAGDTADELLDRLQIARSLRELWHLRTEVFSLVSLQHSQHEADQRLARLNRHFPTRSPRSGFGALEPRDNMWP
ncbi:MAG: hypothetical protein KF788_07145 [Piscinibacter sp.]|nr:hypothetical protein [Piscinibacter sp.]